MAVSDSLARGSASTGNAVARRERNHRYSAEHDGLYV